MKSAWKIVGGVWGGLLLLLCSGALEASVVFKGRAIDGSASVEKFSHQREDFSVPFSQKEVTVELVQTDGQASPKSWKVNTDDQGRFSVDTGLGQLSPAARFAVSAQSDGERLFSPFYLPSETEQLVNLYATTENSSALRARLEINYNVQKSGEASRLRVDLNLHLVNSGDRMFIGRPGYGGWREIFRVPIPKGATGVRQSSPDPTSPGWKFSDDGRWLIIDTPIAGVLDLKSQGVAMGQSEQSGWKVSYTLPATQTLVQAFPLGMRFEQGGVVAWCLHKDMSLESPQLTGNQMENRLDPMTGRQRSFDVVYATRALNPKDVVLVGLTTDNLILGQISRGALWWVGGFVLVLALSAVLGLVLGRKGPSPEILFASLSGEEVLDRIADLDRRYDRNEIREEDYRHYREALMQLADEELASAGSRTTPTTEDAARSGVPEAVREVIARINAIDSSGATDPATIAERTQLLEAMLKALVREDVQSSKRSKE